MTYPEPLYIDDKATGTSTPVDLELYECRGGSPCSQGRVAILNLADISKDETHPGFYLTPTTRDALIDWLVAQREAERSAEESPATLRDGRET